MIGTFHQTSVCQVTCLKHFGTCNVEMFCSNCVSDLAQYPRVSDVQVILQSHDKTVHREMPIRPAVCVTGARLRACQYLLAARRSISKQSRGRIAPHRLVITSTPFQTVAVAYVILILLFEFVVARSSKCCPPKNQCLLDIKPNSL
jgi:hypothetical protein